MKRCDRFFIDRLSDKYDTVIDNLFRINMKVFTCDGIMLAQATNDNKDKIAIWQIDPPPVMANWKDAPCCTLLIWVHKNGNPSPDGYASELCFTTTKAIATANEYLSAFAKGDIDKWILG